MMRTKTVTITGSSGLVGQILCTGLREAGYHVRPFDKVSTLRSRLLHHRYLAKSPAGVAAFVSNHIRHLQKQFAAQTRGLTGDDILDWRSRLAERFKGSDAVIHLAGIPHPYAPGSCDDDFRRINYDGSINVFEATRDAGVPKFIFASSAQVYGINNPVRIDQFPILESNHLPTLAQGQSMYGYLKAEFERYLATACNHGVTQAISLRLEYPGFRSTTPSNFFACTSIENLVHGFAAAIEAPASFTAETFNLVNAEVEPSVVDVQEFLRKTWPHVPNHTKGNESLLGIGKARDLLRYDPKPGGSYFRPELIG